MIERRIIQMKKQQKQNSGFGWIARKINMARASRNIQKQKDTYSDGSHFILINQASFLRVLR